MGLQRYFQKRNFQRTPEPKGREHRAKSKALSFVIQSMMQRDFITIFRLEMRGVLKSWAVPKGRAGAERRQAPGHACGGSSAGVMAGSKEIIPEGITAPVGHALGSWNVRSPWRRSIGSAAKREIHFSSQWQEAEGEWTLVRMRGREELGKEPWLLIKSGEDIKPISAKADDESVRFR